MSGKYSDLFGTLKTKFQIGKGGPQLKDLSGVIQARNAADGAFADISGKVLRANDPDIVLDSDGNALTFSRNSAQSGALQVITPPAKATDGYVLAQKAGTGAGIIELELISAASTASADKIDTTTLLYSDSSPKTMFTPSATDIVTKVQVVIDTPWATGTATLSIGENATPSLFMASTEIDLYAAAATIFEVHPGIVAQGPDAIEGAYAQAGATAGSARLLVYYATPV
jgi:hypothetical protein